MREALSAAPLDLNDYGYDPYGFNPEDAHSFLVGQSVLYRYYFRVETFDIEHVPPIRTQSSRQTVVAGPWSIGRARWWA